MHLSQQTNGFDDMFGYSQFRQLLTAYMAVFNDVVQPCNHLGVGLMIVHLVNNLLKMVAIRLITVHLPFMSFEGDLFT
jgi:hypothetical protein